jgi:hypothetical protein
MKPDGFKILSYLSPNHKNFKKYNFESTNSRKHQSPDNKWFLILTVAALSLFLHPSISKACDLKFGVSGEQKAVYKAGEELIIEVTIVYTHRTCEIQLSDTKFTYEGMKILGATAWKEKAPNTFSRQIKISLLADALPEAKLNIVRKCSKDGAIGTFKIAKTS